MVLLIGIEIKAEETKKAPFFTLKGSVQSDILIPQEDSKINTGTYEDWGLTNTYADLRLLNKYVEAGVRLEFLEFPLPGFEKDFKGWGVPNFYVTGKYKNLELTAGDFYDQFGSGFIFRTYEERSLGIDNSLRGGRFALQSYHGINFKVLGGKQRHYWDHNSSWVYGADLELNIEQWFNRMKDSNTYLMVGGSIVSKHETDEDILTFRPTGEKDEFGEEIIGTYKLNLPKNVAAFDVRTRLQKGGFNILAEYARKSQDPSFDNGYIYHNGSALLLSGSYSQKGMSILLQAKRSEDMSYRSARSVSGTSSFINHLPAFSMQHTYTLAALYPYATQNTLGEWAFQGEFSYNFKRKTVLGGKYGTTVKLNASHIRSLEKTPVAASDLKGTNGYTTKFFATGDDVYYQDINVQIEKKITKSLKLNFMYMNQRYNKTVVEGEGGMVNSNIAVLEAKYQFNNKFTLRGELQYLSTVQDEGDWWFGLLELSVAPSFMFTISDMYNSGATDLHYYMASACYTHKAHRLQLGYGRTRAGYNCSGGVCRFVPASKGLQVSYNFNF
ncbi:MAG: DUF6029 family protein [Muribaculaceae bacterium]|nr:DUF6029 family protein [Muribaculaceae bacterium]